MHHKSPILVRNHQVQMKQPIVRGGSLWSKNIGRVGHTAKRLAAPGFTMGGTLNVTSQVLPRFHVPTPRHAKRKNIRFG